MSDFPWQRLMHIAQIYAVTPEAIWHMTPAALFALHGETQSAPFTRKELRNLMTQFPDRI